MTDVYQERYLEHMARKKARIEKALAEKPKVSPKRSPDFLSMVYVMRNRRSQRVFNDLGLSKTELGWIYEAVRLAPSSCNRQAILVKVIEREQERLRLASLLVGGRDWMSRATTILLLFADMSAYKSPVERDFMPWLDAGFVAENVYLIAEASMLGVCYVNPNVKDREMFDTYFNPRRLLFCGALALGNYYDRDPVTPKRKVEEIFYDAGV